MGALRQSVAGSRAAGLDVLLVSMPFAPLRNPSLGLSLLKAALPGRSVAIRYFTLPFADRIGAALYERFSAGRAFGPLLAGEAIFRNALFPSRPRSLACHLRSDARLAADALRVQRHVDSFLRACVAAVLDSSPRIVGFTSLFQQQVAALALARHLKRARPDLFLVIGGTNCDGPAGRELIRQFEFLDAVVSGEADRVFPEIVERVLRGQDVEGLQGVHTRHNRRLPASQAADAAGGVAHLDELPVPDYSDFFAQWSSSRVGRRLDPYVLFETSRGCWWGQKHHCTFCGVNGPRLAFRRKTQARAIAEFRRVLSRVPARTVLVCDSALEPRSATPFLAAAARQGPRVNIAWAVRPNLRKDQLRALPAAGVREIEPGIESFSDRVLSLMDKGTTALQNVQLLKWCAEIGIRPVWNLIWGFPGEPREEYERMAALLPLLVHLPPPHSWGPVQMARFSPNFEESAARGFARVAPWPAYSYLYPFGCRSVANLAHFFEYAYADGRCVDDYDAPLVAAIHRWRRQYSQADLACVADGKRLLVLDRRHRSAVRMTILGGRMKALYLACDSVRTLASLARQAGTDERTVADSLAPLIEDGLMLRDGDRVLSLAVRRSRQTTPQGTQPPRRRGRPGSV